METPPSRCMGLWSGEGWGGQETRLFTPRGCSGDEGHRESRLYVLRKSRPVRLWAPPSGHKLSEAKFSSRPMTFRVETRNRTVQNLEPP